MVFLRNAKLYLRLCANRQSTRRPFIVPCVARALSSVFVSLLLGLALLVAPSECGGAAQSTKPARSVSNHGAKMAQGTPASLVPNSIAFWDAEHGLIGSGITWRKTGGAISATNDGALSGGFKYRPTTSVSFSRNFAS